MKTIKLSLLTLALLSFGLSNAQVGIQAGYGTETSSEDTYSLKGFHAGLTYEMGIQGPISLQYGLLYNYLTDSETVMSIETSFTKHIIDIPFRIAATFPLTSNGLSAYVFGGPNFNIGIAGNTKIGDTTFEDIYKDQTILGVTLKGQSRFDLQLGLGAGLKYNNVGVRFSYDWGMLNRVEDADPAVTANGLKIGLTYNF
ncbi:MAG: outer membrane beta-barrel protein [Paludibacteraceae bacterium]